ncbi:MAG: hypothetical protein ACM3X6_04165 [Patescibacteria group bacterium]
MYDDLYLLVLAILPDDDAPAPPANPYLDPEGNPVVSFEYDRRGTNITKRVKPDNAHDGQTITYEYHPRYRLKTRDRHRRADLARDCLYL